MLALLALGTLIVPRARASSTWVEYFDDTLRLSAVDRLAVARLDGGYWVVAHAPGPAVTGDEDILLARLDSDGVIQDQKMLGTYDPNVGAYWNEEPTSLLATTDGGLLIVGTYRPLDRNRKLPLLIRLDSSGALLWARAYDCGAEVLVGAAREALDGGFLLTGASSCGGAALWVQKVDSAGAVVWSSAYDAASALAGASIAVSPNGSYLVGTKNLLSSPLGAGVLKLEADGQVSWGKWYQDNISPDQVLATADGGFVIVATSWTGSPTSVWMRRVDGAGQRVAEYWMDGGASQSARAVAGDPSGAWLIAGGRYETLADNDNYLIHMWGDPGRPQSGVRQAELVARAPNRDQEVVSATPSPDGGYLLISGDGQMARVSSAIAFPCGYSLIPLQYPTTSDQSITLAATRRDLTVTTLAPEIVVAGGTQAGDHYCLVTCASLVRVVGGLRAAKTGVAGGDVALSWMADAGADGYNVWYVTDKTEIDQARARSSPPAVAVPACALRSPVAAPSCIDAGAVGRGAPGLFHYQVRSYCSAAFEGP